MDGKQQIMRAEGQSRAGGTGMRDERGVLDRVQLFPGIKSS